MNIVETGLIDAQYVVSAFSVDSPAFDQRCRSTNGDLWRDFAEARKKQMRVKSKKVKSHLPFQSVSNGDLSLEEYALNNLADAAAGVSAKMAQPHESVIKEHIAWQSTAFQIALRIAWIEQWHWKRCPSMVRRPEAPILIAVPEETLKDVRERAYEEAGHSLYKRWQWITCTRCRQSASKKNVGKWLLACDGQGEECLLSRRTTASPRRRRDRTKLRITRLERRQGESGEEGEIL